MPVSGLLVGGPLVDLVEDVLFEQRAGTFELVGADGTIATFDDPQDIDADASAYPRTESEIGDGDGWTTIKAPFVPSLEFDDVEMGDRPDPTMYDVIRVPASSEDGGLEVVEATGPVPLAELFDMPEIDDTPDESAPSDGMISLR